MPANSFDLSRRLYIVKVAESRRVLDFQDIPLLTSW